MTTISKDDSVFYYRAPSARLRSTMTFGWFAVWNGNLYANSFDLTVADDLIADKIKEVIVKIEKNRDDCLNAVSKNPGQKGSYDAKVSDLMQTYGGNSFSSQDIAELKSHLIADKRVPDAIKAKLQ
jgi:hypothetical protein